MLLENENALVKINIFEVKYILQSEGLDPVLVQIEDSGEAAAMLHRYGKRVLVDHVYSDRIPRFLRACNRRT